MFPALIGNTARASPKPRASSEAGCTPLNRFNSSQELMSDIDRVVARLGGSQPAATERRELRSIPRKGGATGSRVVEVVRLPARGAAPGRAPAGRPKAAVRSQTWDGGFPTRAARPGAALEPVAHVTPAWELTAAEAGIEPASTASPAAEPARQPAMELAAAPLMVWPIRSTQPMSVRTACAAATPLSRHASGAG